MEKNMNVFVDTKMYAVINTTAYNDDGKASVQVVMGEEGAADLGWEDDGLTFLVNEVNGDTKVGETKIGDMRVNDIMAHAMYVGAYLMRIA